MKSKKRKLTPKDSVETQVVESEAVTYKVFFHNCLMKGLVRPWQEKEILAFFRDMGLSDKEPSDKYVDALAKY